jgi:hypothetical protein
MSLPETITNKGEDSRNRFRASLPGKESLLDLTHRGDTVAEVRVKYPRTLKTGAFRRGQCTRVAVCADQ